MTGRDPLCTQEGNSPPPEAWRPTTLPSGTGCNGRRLAAERTLLGGDGRGVVKAQRVRWSGAGKRVARGDGAEGSGLGRGMRLRGMGARVWALTAFDDGTGPALYAGGQFTTAGGVAANYVAKWDGSQWSALGSGTDAVVWALTVFDDGTGPALYAGGTFQRAGDMAVNHVAKWRDRKSVV